jgi:hypothetical protein
MKSRSRSQRRRKLVLNRNNHVDRRYGPRTKNATLHPDTLIRKATGRPVPFWTLKAQQDYLKRKSKSRSKTLKNTKSAKRRKMKK